MYLMEKQYFEKALEVLSPTMDQDNPFIEILYNIAICLKELGHYSAVEEMFERVLINSMNRLSLDESDLLVTGFTDSSEKEKLQRWVSDNWKEQRKKTIKDGEIFDSAIREKYRDL